MHSRGDGRQRVRLAGFRAVVLRGGLLRAALFLAAPVRLAGLVARAAAMRPAAFRFRSPSASVLSFLSGRLFLLEVGIEQTGNVGMAELLSPRDQRALA